MAVCLRWLPLPSIFCVLFLTPSGVKAEWMADLYLGGSHTEASDNDFTLEGAAVRPLKNSDASTPGGARLGYWFQGSPSLGLALDVSVFNPDFKDNGPDPLDDRVVLTEAPISLLLMVRFPMMQSDEYASGRFQPYVAVGPSIVFSSLSEFAGRSVSSPAVLEDTSWSAGIDVRGGLTWMINPRIGAFLEYRYLKTKPSFDSVTGGGTVKYNPTFTTNAAALGLTYRF